MKEVSAQVKALNGELTEVEGKISELASTLPNLPDPDAPDGMTEEDSTELRVVGDPPEFDFEPLDHLELGERHGWIEMEAAAELSGSRFAYLLGDLVMVEMALVRYALETLRAEGFTPVAPPVLVREEALYGTGFFPGEREMIYEVPNDELFLVGTSEVSLASLKAGTRWMPGSCRCATRASRPASAARRARPAATRAGSSASTSSTRSRCSASSSPSESRREHERILALQEKILAALEIPYRVVDIAVGDLGASASRKFDCEGWIPSQQRYRELTSCSNTTDYQARRLRARYRPVRGGFSGGGPHTERHRGGRWT